MLYLLKYYMEISVARSYRIDFFFCDQENNLMVEPTFFSEALIKSGKFSV